MADDNFLTWQTNLTPQLTEVLALAAGKGCNQLECAIIARVHPNALDLWVSEGKTSTGHPAYQDLVIRMGQALIETKIEFRESGQLKATGANWLEATRDAYEELAHDMTGRDILQDFYGDSGLRSQN